MSRSEATFQQDDGKVSKPPDLALGQNKEKEDSVKSEKGDTCPDGSEDEGKKQDKAVSRDHESQKTDAIHG